MPISCQSWHTGPRCNFKPGDSDDHQLRRLTGVKYHAMAALYAHHTQYDSCVPHWQGIRWITVTYCLGSGPAVSVYQWRADLNARIGVEWNSENQNDYYYGVSRKESSRSGLRGYNPKR